jgi:hypothetical protein
VRWRREKPVRKNVSQQLGLKGVNIDEDSSGLSIIANSGFATLGDASFIPLITINNLYQEVANVTYLRGSRAHTSAQARSTPGRTYSLPPSGLPLKFLTIRLRRPRLPYYQ